MKTIDTLKATAIGLLALATSGVAHAQNATTIYITGSNGDRTATQAAISKILATGWKYQGSKGSTDSSGDLKIATGDNYGAWNGSFNGQPVIIKTTFSGALAGIAAVAGKTNQRYVVGNGTGSGTVPDPVAATDAANYVVAKADFGFSTNFQSTSPFNKTYNKVIYSALVEEIVGVSPLGFYASPGFPAGLNITTQLARQLYTNGSLPLSFFTGNWTNGDQNKIVWAIGRNTDAGQRFGVLREIGLNGLVKNEVKVVKPTITGATTVNGTTYGGTVSSHALWPAETVSDIPSDLGNGGYNSGANLAPALTAVLGPDAYKGVVNGVAQYPDATAGYYIGYLTPGDASSRVLSNSIPAENRGVALSFNGVDNTTANIQSGRYSLWVYNRALRRAGDLTKAADVQKVFNAPGQTIKKDFYLALVDKIKTDTATQGGGLKNDASFLVKRLTDGGIVLQK